MCKDLTDIQQNYLEKIYEIIIEKKGVKVKDIAEKMNVKNPSVTSALRTLVEAGCINYEPYGVISLTQKGESEARYINSIHIDLKYFFREILGIDERAADETACRMEHILSKDVYKRFSVFIKFIRENRYNGEFIKKIGDFIADDKLKPNIKKI